MLSVTLYYYSDDANRQKAAAFSDSSPLLSGLRQSFRLDRFPLAYQDAPPDRASDSRYAHDSGYPHDSGDASSPSGGPSPNF